MLSALFIITGMADFFWVWENLRNSKFQELGVCFSNKAGNLALSSTLERFLTVLHFCKARALFLAGHLSSVTE